MLKILNAFERIPDGLDEVLADYETTLIGPENLISTVKQGSFHIVLFEKAVNIIEQIRFADPRIEIVTFVTSEDEGLEAIQHGASGFHTFPVDPAALKTTLDGVADTMELRRETGILESELADKYNTAGIVARNPKMLGIIDFIKRISPHYRTVTVTGETGTGKEVAARALHFLSPVARNPFLTCNCGGLVETLLESELFGHLRGSFTGATADKTGLFEATGEGTLFLDEIGELPLAFQPKFLRVLQDGEFRKVGSNKASYAKCRIITATSRDLAEDVEKGLFREDLYYRLIPITIHLPPLRERKDDIPLLCRNLLNRFTARTGKKISGISRPAQAILMAYNWPGNVRELDNVLEQASVLATESFLKPSDLPARLLDVGENAHEADTPGDLDAAIRDHISAALDFCQGNRTHTARILGISRRSLLRKIEKYNLRERKS